MDSPRFKNIYLLIAIILGVSLMAGSWILGAKIASTRSNIGITVTGSVKTKVTADLAKWSGTFTRQAGLSDLKASLESADADAKKIKAFIKGFGIEDASIRFNPVRTDPVYEQLAGYGQSQNVVGYTIQQEVVAENVDIAKIEKLATDSKKLIDQGIVPQYQNTEYFYTKIEQLRPKLFADATKDAKDRASAIAGGMGAKVGAIKSAKTGVIQIMQPNSVDVSDWGSYDTSTKEKEVSATVTVTFDLE